MLLRWLNHAKIHSDIKIHTILFSHVAGSFTPENDCNFNQQIYLIKQRIIEIFELDQPSERSVEGTSSYEYPVVIG